MRRTLLALGLAGALLAGCGGDDEEPAATPAATAEEPAAAARGRHHQGRLPRGGPAGAAPTAPAPAPAPPADAPAPAPGGEPIDASPPADGSLVFAQPELSAPAGAVTLAYD